MSDGASHDSSGEARPLLGPDDPEPADVRRAGAGALFLFICDHAGRAVPRRMGDMGVSPADWDRHIAWDIGAGALTERLAAAFEAPAVLQRYSRLVIDCNREPARDDAIPRVSDGVAIPANADVAPEERARRVREIHASYHRAISSELDARVARGAPTVLVFVHSFTPRLGSDPAPRPWRYGVLHHGGSPASAAMLRILRERSDAPVGDNAPYAFDLTDYSAPRHAVARHIDYVELEVRQDLLGDAEGVAATGAFLEQALRTLATTLP